MALLRNVLRSLAVLLVVTFVTFCLMFRNGPGHRPVGARDVRHAGGHPGARWPSWGSTGRCWCSTGTGCAARSPATSAVLLHRRIRDGGAGEPGAGDPHRRHPHPPADGHSQRAPRSGRGRQGRGDRPRGAGRLRRGRRRPGVHRGHRARLHLRHRLAGVPGHRLRSAGRERARLAGVGDSAGDRPAHRSRRRRGRPVPDRRAGHRRARTTSARSGRAASPSERWCGGTCCATRPVPA